MEEYSCSRSTSTTRSTAAASTACAAAPSRPSTRGRRPCRQERRRPSAHHQDHASCASSLRARQQLLRLAAHDVLQTERLRHATNQVNWRHRNELLVQLRRVHGHLFFLSFLPFLAFRKATEAKFRRFELGQEWQHVVETDFWETNVRGLDLGNTERLQRRIDEGHQRIHHNADQVVDPPENV